MRHAVLAACCALTCTAALSAQTNPHASAADVELGRKLYIGRCGHCHGLDGEGGRGSSLNTGRFRHGGSDRELFLAIRNGIPNTEMPGAPILLETEIWRIVAHVQQLGRRGAFEPISGDAAAGAVVYQKNGCAACHSIDSKGGFLGQDLTDVGAKRALWHLRESVVNPDADIPLDHRSVVVTTTTGQSISGIHLNEDEHSIQLRDMSGNLRSFMKAELKDVKLPRKSLMPAYASIPKAELENLVAYLSSLRPPVRVGALDGTVWSFDRLERIGGHAATVLGEPRLIDSPAGRAVEFNGVDDALIIDDHPLAGAKTFTLEAIFRPDGGQAEQRWLHLSERDPATGKDTENRMLLEIRVVGDQWFLDSYHQSGSANKALLNRKALHPVGAWYHVATVYDGQELRNYVDGVQEGVWPLKLAASGPGHTSVGARINKVSYFKGAVHMARFTRRALAPSEFLEPPSRLGAAPPQATTHDSAWFSGFRAGRSIVRAGHGMVATSQPLASAVGLDVLKHGGNAVDAAIAMAAVLNVTEPHMTGIGGDAFAMVYWSKTGKLEAINSTGRAPRALSLEYFRSRDMTQMPAEGMATITVPGAVEAWVSLLEKYGTLKLAELLAPAITLAENGFPVAEKTAEDWAPEVEKLRRTQAAASTFLVDGRAPAPGATFVQRNLARTLRALARGGRDAFYTGEIARAIVDYCRSNGGFLTLQDLAAHKADWVEPISTTYKGYALHELPPNNQGLAALILLNILEGIDLQSMKNDPVRYYHTLIEATKIAFADRNRYIADPAFAKLPVRELLSKDYAARRRALIDPTRAIEAPTHGDLERGSDTTYFAVVDKDRNAVSFINSIFNSFGSGIVAGDTGIVLHNRGTGFSLKPDHPNRYEPGKRPFTTLIPAMVFKDGKLLMSYGVMGGDVQAQGHAQVLVNLVERGLNLQEAIDAPRVRYIGGKRVMMEDELTEAVISGLVRLGHERALPPAGLRHRIFMGGGQAVMIDPATGALLGASDARKDGLALGY